MALVGAGLPRCETQGFSASSGLKGQPFFQPGLKALDSDRIGNLRAEGPTIRQHGSDEKAVEWPARWAFLWQAGEYQGLQPWL